MARPASSRSQGRRRLRRTVGVGAVLAVAASLLSACGSSSGKPTLTWYINPDSGDPTAFPAGQFGQPGIASRCSTDAYTVTTQELPGDATQQRIQLARRLAAKDTGIDLMSLDPVFTGEFSDADFLLPIPQGEAQQLSSGVLKGAVQGATWRNKLVVAPLWANTQLLWYRKSFVQKAGLDMTKPVTWSQIIDAASKNGGTVGVEANKYEGYVVWINALIQGAGGNIVTDTAAGDNAKVTINSTAGVDAAKVISQLAHSKAAEPDLSVSNEGTVLGPFATSAGAFQLNWTFTYGNYASDKKVQQDIGWAPYPETVAGKPSKPPLGGINVGINTSTKYPKEALEAVKCITSEQNQVEYAVQTGNMPARAAAYDAKALKKGYPTPLLKAFRSGLNAAGPRPISPYWSDISSAVQSTWHPPTSVSTSTPSSSATFISDVLHGKALL
jgi:trehalose/maltose transport system substrate-binding protein